MMSVPPDPPHGGTTESDTAHDLDPNLVVELLSDDDAVSLFQTATSPMTIRELATQCEIAQSTTYRKIETLVDAGLLRETTPKNAAGSPPARYERVFSAVTVTLDNEIAVRTTVPRTK